MYDINRGCTQTSKLWSPVNVTGRTLRSYRGVLYSLLCSRRSCSRPMPGQTGPQMANCSLINSFLLENSRYAALAVVGTLGLRGYMVVCPYVVWTCKQASVCGWQASLSTRASQWWASVPSVTAAVVVLCGAIYVTTLLLGYDSFDEVCLSPSSIVHRWQVYRAYTSAVFHASILHVVFNMLALVPIGSALERMLGSFRYLHVLFLLATSNALIQVVIAYVAAYNPVHGYLSLLYECGIGFSGVIFALIVMETSLSTAQTRSIFGFFNVPAKWYPWALLILFQFLMPRVSLLGHLSGILSGFAYTFGLFNVLLLSPAKYANIEGSHLLAPLIRRSGFIVGGSAGTPSLSLPSYSMPSAGGRVYRRVMSSMQSWMPQAQQPPTDERFPGRGQVLGPPSAIPPPPVRQLPTFNAGSRRLKTGGNQSELQTRLLDHTSQGSTPEMQQGASAVTSSPVRSGALGQTGHLQEPSNTAEDQEMQGENGNLAISSLVSMGFDQTTATHALVAANGDIVLAVEILSAQG